MGADARVWLAAGGEVSTASSPEELLSRTATGDEAAFGSLYDMVAGQVFGLVLRVLRDRGQAEEVCQEALLDVWRQATRFDPARGGALSWVLTIAHRRAVDRVRSAQAAVDREDRAGRMDVRRPFDEVAEATMASLDRQRVRQCLAGLTAPQRESIMLAYYDGHTYQQVGEVLAMPTGTVKTRIRDGLIRLRDCLGVAR